MQKYPDQIQLFFYREKKSIDGEPTCHVHALFTF